MAKLRTTASTASFSTAGFPGLPGPAAPGPSPIPTPPYRLWSCSGGGGGGGPDEAVKEAGEGNRGAMGTVTPGRREERRVPVAPETYPIPGCSLGGRMLSGRTLDSIVQTSRLQKSRSVSNKVDAFRHEGTGKYTECLCCFFLITHSREKDSTDVDSTHMTAAVHPYCGIRLRDCPSNDAFTDARTLHVQMPQLLLRELTWFSAGMLMLNLGMPFIVLNIFCTSCF